MPTSVETLAAAALQLSPDDRARLLERLAASLPTDPEVEEAWEREAERREAELIAGTIQPVSGDEALARLRGKLR